MSSHRVTTVAASFGAAKSWQEYRAAKCEAGKLSINDQLALVDNIIAACKRLELETGIRRQEAGLS